MFSSLLALAAAALVSATADSPPSAAGEPQPPTAQTPAATPAVERPGDKIICKKAEVTGSRLGAKTVCRKLEDWNNISRRGKENMEYLQWRHSTNSVGGLGGGN